MNTIPWRTSGPLWRASLATLGCQSRVETFQPIIVKKHRPYSHEFRFSAGLPNAQGGGNGGGGQDDYLQAAAAAAAAVAASQAGGAGGPAAAAATAANGSGTMTPVNGQMPPFQTLPYMAAGAVQVTTSQNFFQSFDRFFCLILFCVHLCRCFSINVEYQTLSQQANWIIPWRCT